MLRIEIQVVYSACKVFRERTEAEIFRAEPRFLGFMPFGKSDLDLKMGLCNIVTGMNTPLIAKSGIVGSSMTGKPD